MFGSFKRFAFAGITTGMVALFTATTPAHSVPAPAAAHKSVCDTGYRGQKEYDSKCLRTGTIGDAAKVWASVNDRLTVCKTGNVRREAVELVTDVTYDRFRNNKKVNGWVADQAQGECLRLGYADPVSGLVPVNLRALPKGECWVEVSYANRAHTKINRETLCKG